MSLGRKNGLMQRQRQHFTFTDTAIHAQSACIYTTDEKCRRNRAKGNFFLEGEGGSRINGAGLHCYRSRSEATVVYRGLRVAREDRCM